MASEEDVTATEADAVEAGVATAVAAVAAVATEVAAVAAAMEVIADVGHQNISTTKTTTPASALKFKKASEKTWHVTTQTSPTDA